MAGKMEVPWDCMILETLLSPLDEDVTRSQDSQRQDDCLYRVCAVKAGLVIGRSINKGERQETLLSDAVVI
jgi:hypothetical protein